MITTNGVPGTRILGLGHYRPANVITNDDLVARGIDTNDEWIRSRVGIEERRWPIRTRPSSTWASRPRPRPWPRAASASRTSTC